MQRILFFIAFTFSTFLLLANSQVTPEDLKKYNISDDAIKEYLDKQETNQTNLNLSQVPQPLEAKTSDVIILKDWEDSLRKVNNTNQNNTQTENVFGHSIFKNNSILIYQKAKDAIAQENYKLGVGDEIAVTIWGYTDYSEKFRISEDGHITPRQIGRIYLKGLSFGKAKELLRSKFGNVIDLNNSDFEVSLIYSRVITINIVGEVDNPGSYVIPAINTPFNALMATNGLKESGSIRNIYIKRQGKTIDSLDVYKFLTDEKYYNDIFLENNDYIHVNIAKKIVKIDGAVRRPHKYELKPAETLEDLLKLCGGFTGNSYTKNILIKRYIDNELRYININYDSLKETKSKFHLYDEDIVSISQISDFATNRVVLQGEVNIPGEYEFRQGDKISDVLDKAEGITYHAYTEKAYIIRLDEAMQKKYIDFNLHNALNDKNSSDNIELKELDIVKILSKEDFLDFFKVFVVGAVRRPDTIMYGNRLSLKDALLICGGLQKQSAEGRIEIARIIGSNNDGNKVTPVRAFVATYKIKDDLSIEGGDINSIMLEPYDIVYVRKNPIFDNIMSVRLTGEVKYPGVYSILKKDERLVDLIERAGGLTEFAFIQGTQIKRNEIGSISLNMEKALQNKKSYYNILLHNEDHIYIPRSLDIISISGATSIIKDNPINVAYASNKRAKYYIKEFAGGFDEHSNRGRTYVVYPNGITKKTTRLGIINIYPKIKKDSKIIIPSKPEKKEKQEKDKKVDWNKTIENTTIKVTGILTLWLLLKNINQ